MESLKLEIVRPGPLHGQLLSQLTYYIALCDGIEADTLRFPFDQYELKADLKSLRYYVGAQGDEIVPNRLRADAVERLSRRLADCLEQLRSFQTRLAEMHAGDRLRHLRLVLGGNELSLIPFELSGIPRGWRGAGSKLLLQGGAPIVLTRELRGSSQMPVRWNRKPRVLFCCASPAGYAPPPAEAHLLALTNSLRPWVDGGSAGAHPLKIEHVVTVLEHASLPAIRSAVERATDEGAPFTHVHFLCHGCPLPNQPERYGIVLAHHKQPLLPDPVDASALARALIPRTRDCIPPTMVVLASCDSANQSSVETPGSSLAHELHQHGIPWVLASQLPLTFAGSATIARILYGGLFEGKDPRIVLHEVRQELTRHEDAHDWASLVAYAAVPHDFDVQVRSFRLSRLRALIDSAFGRASALAEPEVMPREFLRIEAYLKQWREALEGLADDDAEWTEYLGMTGAVAKQQAGFNPTGPEALAKLSTARISYGKAARRKLTNHWVVAQYLSLSKLLGRVPEHGWSAVAEAAAELDFADSNRAIWSLGTLLELALLNDDGCAGRKTFLEWTSAFARAVDADPDKWHFERFSTVRQLHRYTNGQFAHLATDQLKQRARDALAILETKS
ncbi:MAG TPA: CHAT domain-containing protein [Polyangiaceae bacterium]|nr:CHAT domain-containing protein [Polyangiaceae bacterium]